MPDQRAQRSDQSSLCCGRERLTRNPGMVIATWLHVVQLPAWPTGFALTNPELTRCQPAFSIVLTASLPEIFASRVMQLHGYDDLGLAGLGISGCLSVLGPQPCEKSFFHIGQRFLLILTL
jgi:hypothetical protein